MEPGIASTRRKVKPGGRATRQRGITVPDSVSTSDRVLAFFKQQFMSGALKPGDKLLPERELAQHLGVSRPTLREAMRTLNLLGVVDIRPGQNAAVSAPSASVLQDFFSVLLSMRPSIYEHILEARIAIECEAVRLACINAQDADFKRLDVALERVLATAANESLGAEADFEFHTQIVMASHNEVLRFIHEAIGALLRRSHRERRQAIAGEPEFVATLGEAHRQILRALKARDPEACEIVVRRHFFIAQEYWSRKRGGAPATTRGGKT
jgi:DNA-binding FadR family transcriptional regulator